MVRETSGDRSFADEFDKRISARRLVKVLCTLRAAAGLTQQELAVKLGCTQSKISKLESGSDAELRFGDIVAYSQACGCSLSMFFARGRPTLVEQVKQHALAIKRLLCRLAQLAGDDGVMVKAVATFCNEAAFNLVNFVQEAAASLPDLPGETTEGVRIEAPGADEECDFPDEDGTGPAGSGAALHA